MKLATRLKLILVLWFAIVMVAFTAIYVFLFHERSVSSYRHLLQLELSYISSGASANLPNQGDSSNWAKYAILKDSAIRILNPAGKVASQVVSGGFPSGQIGRIGVFVDEHYHPLPSVSTTSVEPLDNTSPSVQWLPTYTFVDHAGTHSVLGVSEPILFPTGLGRVQVFSTLDSVTSETTATLRFLLWTDIVTFIFLATGAHWLVNRGIRPLRQLIDGIRSVEWYQAKRLELGNVPIEIQSVANSVNQLLDKVEHGIHDQRQFITDASHELRTPLAIIAGHANLLRRWGKMSEKVWEPAVHHIVSEVDRLQKLVDNLLTLSRFEAGASPEYEELSDVDIRKILEHLRDDARILRSDLQVFSHIHLQQDGVLMMVKDDLRQIFVILLDNAMRHTFAGGTVQLLANSDENTVRLTVTDTGEGIPDHALPNIFHRFYRAEGTRAADSSGSGLGLSICRGIVEFYHGRISVSSTVGKGTTVTMSFPFVRSEA